MSPIDESRWKKHGERWATVTTDDRGNAACLRSSMRDREQLLFAARVDIDVYDASGNIVHIAVLLSISQTAKRKRRLRPLECAGSILFNSSYCIRLIQPTLSPARLQLDCSENVDEEVVMD
ncbi:hypothetical protein AVEN_131404-1 [Araneus ventricosus]|uniref:Uncharacterized protein n=1 Tax=Araneus ventricosus TaxID=182803 RepID=A0A4Y2GUA3_ARAVE|nr:hypothetical protein AVEN_131404-1 [Araneus ventricosus]